ncbi:MAG: GTPase [Promethearchaeota archaeon]
MIKIFVTGFFNSGKSTLIHTLDSEAIHVEKKLRTPYENGKTHTTTGFDHGKIIWAKPNENSDGVIMSNKEYFKDKKEYENWVITNIELKGTPGQIQYSSVRKALARGCQGVLFLIDGTDIDNIGNALVILEETKSYLGKEIPMVIIANKSDREDYHGCEFISNLIGEDVFPGSAKYNMGIKDAVIKLLRKIINKKEQIAMKKCQQ